jgi:hypothetical protein
MNTIKLNKSCDKVRVPILDLVTGIRIRVIDRVWYQVKSQVRHKIRKNVWGHVLAQATDYVKHEHD